MKSKILNFLLLLTSLIGYLEWGKDNKQFLFQVEAEIVSKLFTDPTSVIHPLIILPFVGQLLLLITLFQKRPGKLLTFTGMAGIGILLVLMFVIGLIDFNYKIIISTIPFIAIGFIIFMNYRNK